MTTTATATATEDDLETLSDEQLVQKALNAETDRRCEEAFAELVDRYDHRGLFVQKYGCRPETAERLEQEKWSRVWKHLHRFDPDEANFSTWTNIIAGNLGKNRIRNRSRSPLRHNSDVSTHVAGEEADYDFVSQTKPDELGPDNMTQTPLPDPERSYRFNELAAALEKAIGDLNPTRRGAMRLWLEGLDYESIAREQDVPTGTVKSRLNRARNALAKELRERGFQVYGGILNEKRG